MKSLHLATLDDVDRLLPLIGAFHVEMGFDTDAVHQAQAAVPLLEGSPHGAIWLIGPRKAPVGYVAVSFGWSMEFGGLDATVDELFVRAAVRRRGMGGDALDTLCKALAEAGVCALHLEVGDEDADTQRFYRRARFHPREGQTLMSRGLG